MEDLKQIQSASGMKFVYLTQALCNFGFYGMKSIFVLYVIQQLSFDNKQAIALFATFMSLSYATSLIGGTIADKYLGIKNSILLGGFLSFSGLLWFVFPSQEPCFIGLALMSLGSGFFKPNLSTSVGLFFDNPRDPLKDRAYSVYYMSMNVGGLLAPLVCGFVSKAYGWDYGLLLIAASFLTATYLFNKGVHFGHNQEVLSKLSKTQTLFLSCFLILVVVVLYVLLRFQDCFHGLMGVIALGSIAYIAKVFYECTIEERRNVRTIILSIGLFALFCSFFEQAGSSLLLFFEQAVDRHLFTILVPASAFLSLNPILVLICTPILIYLLKTYFERTKPLGGFFKMGIGFIFVSFSFFFFSLSTCQGNSLISPWWIIGASFIQTLGELLIVPIGFSTVSKYAPQRFRSVMMSFWLMAIAYGHYFAGVIAKISVGKPLEASSDVLERYGSFFFSLGLIPFAVAILLLSYQGVKTLKAR